jgi:hypothetical protein
MASVYVRQLKHGPVWYARVRTLESRWVSHVSECPMGLAICERLAGVR